MFRVRKISRALFDPEEKKFFMRVRFHDFKTLYQRFKKGKAGMFLNPQKLEETKRINQRVFGQDKSWQNSFKQVEEGKAFILGLPISTSSFLPSMLEVLRCATALRLQEFLQQRGLRPCLIGLWPTIPAHIDEEPRSFLDRSGVSHQHEYQKEGLSSKRAQEGEGLLSTLPFTWGESAGLAETDFSAQLRKELEALLPCDPLTLKLRILLRYLLPKQDTIVLHFPEESEQEETKHKEQKQVARYRRAFNEVLESFPVLGLVYSTRVDEWVENTLAPLSLKRKGYLAFPAVSATIVENKVERWLDKYSLQPEQMMEPGFQAAHFGRFLPQNPLQSVRQTRERVLEKLFRLEHQLELLSSKAHGASIEKLAYRLDGQFDKLLMRVQKVEKSEREIVIQQLSKIRNYLRPNNRPQQEVMGLLHYMNFYGPGFLKDLIRSLEIGDSRHHILYTAN